MHLHRDKVAAENELIADTTVQEANVTYPTETKLRTRVIERLWTLGAQAGVSWERSSNRTVKTWHRVAAQRSNCTVKARHKATGKLRTAGRSVLRQYRSKKTSLQEQSLHRKELAMIERILTQSFDEAANKRIHSVHDPTVRCIAKGKAHKNYEWGCKADFAALAQSTVIVGVASFEDNLYDDDFLPKTLASATYNSSKLFPSVQVDRGYAGQTRIGLTEVVQPTLKGHSSQNAYQKRKHRKRMHRRSAIEPVTGHLKNDFRMARC